MIAFLIKYRKVIALSALLLSLVGAYLFIKRTGYLECKKDVIIERVTIAEKRNEIANNRPSDDAVFFNGLLDSATEW